MTERTVTVRLAVDNSVARRSTLQSEQDFRRLAQSATAAGAEQQAAFQRAAAGTSSAFERTATAAQASGRLTQESMRTASASVGRLAAAADEVPVAFRSASGLTEQALRGISTSAVTAASAVTSAETRMSEATAASAAGIRDSLAVRLAAAEAVTVQEGALAAATRTSGASQATTLGRLARAGEGAEKALGGVRTAGVLLMGIFAGASLTAAHFEKSMSGVGAVADANTKQLGQLRTAALEAGRDTSFSASQAADAEGELARAGVSVANITGGALRGALALAAAGQLSLAESAEISAQTMNTFGLGGKDVTHIADVLAAAANKSAADVHGLGEAMRMGGLLAHQTGLTFEDTSAVLAMFADHALIGSDAGTSLKTMLQRLTPQSTQASNMMAALGFSAYDAQGNFVGLTELAGRMKDSFSQLTPEARNSAMGVVFGSDAVRAATILYEQGAAGVNTYRRSVDDQGAASRMASAQLNNLSGDLEALRGSLEVALIQGGTAANKVLREMVQLVTDVVNAYASLPSWAQTSAVALTAVVGALALAAAGFLLVMPRIAAFQTSLQTLAVTMPRLTAAASATTSFLTGPWGIALGLAVAALGVFGLANSSAKKQTEDLTEAVKADGAAVGANTKAWLAHKLETGGVLKAAQDLQLSTADLTEAILGNDSALRRVTGALQPFKDQAADAAATSADAATIQEDWQKNLGKVEDALKTMRPEIDGSVAAAKREAEASGSAADSTSKLGTSALKTADDLKETRSETEKLSDTLAALNGVNINAMQGAISYQGGLAALTKAVTENGHSLDITTEKGRAVKSAVLDAAEAAMKHAEAVGKQTNSADAANIALGQDIDQLKHVMQQAGFTKDQITALTTAYASIPSTVTTQVTDPGALRTIADLQDVRKKVEDVPPGKSVTVRAPTAEAIQDLEAIGFKVEHLPGNNIRVTVPVDDAFNSANRIQRVINSIDGRTVRVTVYQDYVTNGSGKPLPLPQANGGITGMAEGGFTTGALDYRGRQAGFANRPILWAEAGPEAYIPLSPDKRPRSTRILAATAERFGYQLAPLTPAARDLIPARQLIGPAPAASATYDHSRTQTVVLNGAKQSSAEQRADLMRHLMTVS